MSIDNGSHSACNKCGNGHEEPNAAEHSSKGLRLRRIETMLVR